MHECDGVRRSWEAEHERQQGPSEFLIPPCMASLVPAFFLQVSSLSLPPSPIIVAKEIHSRQTTTHFHGNHQKIKWSETLGGWSDWKLSRGVVQSCFGEKVEFSPWWWWAASWSTDVTHHLRTWMWHKVRTTEDSLQNRFHIKSAQVTLWQKDVDQIIISQPILRHLSALSVSNDLKYVCPSLTSRGVCVHVKLREINELVSKASKHHEASSDHHN